MPRLRPRLAARSRGCRHGGRIMIVVSDGPRPRRPCQWPETQATLRLVALRPHAPGPGNVNEGATSAANRTRRVARGACAAGHALVLISSVHAPKRGGTGIERPKRCHTASEWRSILESIEAAGLIPAASHRARHRFAVPSETAATLVRE
jgi:hypothetical protein